MGSIRCRRVKMESKSLYQQLREQGLKFNDDVGNTDCFEDVLTTIENLHIYGYVTRAELARIKKRFFKDLEGFTSKIEK